MTHTEEKPQELARLMQRQNDHPRFEKPKGKRQGGQSLTKRLLAMNR